MVVDGGGSSVCKDRGVVLSGTKTRVEAALVGAAVDSWWSDDIVLPRWLRAVGRHRGAFADGYKGRGPGVLGLIF